MAELLNTFLHVFTTENTNNLPDINNIFLDVDSEKLSDVLITPELVHSKLSKLKMNKSRGIDFVGSRMLIELSSVISDFVADLFIKSLNTGDVPHDWRLANVTAIFKKGKKCSPSNYRPISLTVNICKVLESIIRDKIIEHLEKHTLVRDSQHRFVRNKSCVTNLLVFVEEVANYLDSRYPVDVIYLDFQKAFDKVPHKRLILKKLGAHGIDGKLLEWIEKWFATLVHLPSVR